jgi:hypothetical protein
VIPMWSMFASSSTRPFGAASNNSANRFA